MSNLPTGDPETFVGEAENMNLDELIDKVFAVAVACGSPDKCKYIPESIHGPYGFYEMVGEVYNTWTKCSHHAKVIILDKDPGTPPKFLDECTIDFLEAKGQEIIVEGMLCGESLEKDFTCRAGLIDANQEDDPRSKVEENEDVEESR